MIKNKNHNHHVSFRLIACDDQPRDDHVSRDGDDENHENKADGADIL